MPRKSERSGVLARLGRVVREDVTRKQPVKPTDRRIAQAKDYTKYLTK